MSDFETFELQSTHVFSLNGFLLRNPEIQPLHPNEQAVCSLNCLLLQSTLLLPPFGEAHFDSVFCFVSDFVLLCWS